VFLSVCRCLDTEHYTKLITQYLGTSGAEQQSGSGADDQSGANVLWALLDKKCGTLLNGKAGNWRLFSAGAHSTDLLPHVSHAVDLMNRKKEGGLEPVHPTKDPIEILALEDTYYTTTFAPRPTNVRIHVTKEVPVNWIGYTMPAQEDEDNQVAACLKEINKILDDKEAIRIVMVEPLMVPTGGKCYLKSFPGKLTQAMKAREGRRIFIVADETLSFVRSGFPLYSSQYENFLPDFVMIGKGLGCALLLGSTNLDTEMLGSAFGRAFSLLGSASMLLQCAATLYFFEAENVAKKCLEEGKLIVELEHFKQRHVPNRTDVRDARGSGYCIWLNEPAIISLPINATQNGRLLPRWDQNSKTLQAVLNDERSIAQKFKNAGKLDSIRCYNCGLCGDQATAGDESNVACKMCPRIWHAKCIENEYVNEKCGCGASLKKG
jgi:hypothetical protein